MRVLLALPLVLMLAACGAASEADDADTLAAELAEGAVNGGDPMVRAALADPIMTNPQLSTRSNLDAVRPPAQPYAAPIPASDVAPVSDNDGVTQSAPAPAGDCRGCADARDSLTLAALAARQPKVLEQGCASGVAYGAGWVARLPADLPLHPAARVTEAAGNDTNGCRLRAVSFTIARPLQSTIDWYYARAIRAGYLAEHRADDDLHMLRGARKDGAAYVLFLTSAPRGGTAVEMIVNGGR